MKVELKNTTKKLCVIGDPVLHSKSPLIQNTIISALGLDYIYLCQPVKREELPRWLAAAKAAGYAGFNATMPHKEDLVTLMDELDEDAKCYGSVNTVCIKNSKLYGYNTDGRGFLRALLDEGIDPAGKRVVLLGAGGASKAVALKLVQAGVKSLVICNRTEEKAAALCAYSDVMSTELFDPASLRRAVSTADLLVNGTSLGMDGGGGQFDDVSFLEALPKAAAVCDLVYYPAQTELLARAKALGHTTMNGLGMLLNQAIFALEHFTETDLDVPKLRALAENALNVS